MENRIEDFMRKMSGSRKKGIARFPKKLSENQGATIILALVIFLIATMMSMVIVTAAMNNVRRVKRQRDYEQDNLAVSSAVSYIQELFDGLQAVSTECDGEKEWTFDYSKCGMNKLSTNQAFREPVEELIKKGTPSFLWQLTSKDAAISQALGVWLQVRREGKGIIVEISKSKPDVSAEKTEDAVSLTFTERQVKKENIRIDTDEDGHEIEKKEDIIEFAWNYQSIKR